MAAPSGAWTRTQDPSLTWVIPDDVRRLDQGRGPSLHATGRARETSEHHIHFAEAKLDCFQPDAQARDGWSSQRGLTVEELRSRTLVPLKHAIAGARSPSTTDQRMDGISACHVWCLVPADLFLSDEP